MKKFPEHRTAGIRLRRMLQAGSPVARLGAALTVVAGLWIAAAAAANVQAQEPREGHALPEPLVYLRDIDGSILQDIRYAGVNNFTGRHVPGYAAGECVLLREAAEALARVQQDLAARKLSLKVYDCYRPRRAVRAFVDWVKDDMSGGNPLLKRFYPKIESKDLISLGYIAAVSHHSLGETVDLTIVQLPVKPDAPFKPDTAYGPCTGPAHERAPDNSIDMGTGYDCFDELSHTKAAGITPEQRRWRETLVEAMAKQGFRNYAREWWHFTLSAARSRRTYDVPILPPPSPRLP